MIFSFFVWVLFNEPYTLRIETFTDPLFRLLVIAVIYACLSLFYAKYFLPNQKLPYENAKTIRYLGILGDITACTGAVYLAGPFGLLIYPVFITIVIGYGFRFGLRYFFVAEAIGLLAIIWLVWSDVYLSSKPYLSASLIFGMFIIPTYSAFLLRKYQNVLEKLEETNQARTRFIAHMSHELRTPLHAIIINSELLIETVSSQNTTDNLVKPLNIILEASSHLKILVDHVLDISSGESNAFKLSTPSEFDLFGLINRTILIGTAQAKKKGLNVIYTMAPSVHRFVIGSKKEISAVLLNVLSNAAKFTENGLIKVHINEEPDSDGKSEGRTITIKISDTGCGMTTEQLQSAFDPFVLGDDSSSRHYEGTGIGLTICRQYIEAMSGSIEISSQLGVGTTVNLRIPTEINSEGKSNEPIDYTRFICVANDNVEEDNRNLRALAKLDIDIVPLKEISGLINNTVEKDCLLVDDSLATSQYLRQLKEMLDQNIIAIVLVGKGWKDFDEIDNGFRYRIDKVCVDALSDVAALCFFGSWLTNYDSRDRNQLDTKNLLLIDDNENNLASAELVLRNAGHKVDAVTSGDEGISKLLKHQYDLVFIDMHMPQKNGLETLMSAKQVITGELPPVVFLTADVTAQAEIDASAVGISGFLTKPISPSSLRNAVERFGAKSPVLESVSSANNDEFHSVAYGEVDDMLARGISKDEVLILLEKFSSDINQNFLEAAVLAAQEDAKHVRKLIHRMQGSAGAMHFSQLAGRLASLEEMSEADLCRRYLASAVDLQTLSDSLVHGMKNYLFDES